MSGNKKIVIEPAPSGVSDVMAKAEQEALVQNRLNEHGREDSVRKHLHRATIIGIYLALVFFTAASLVWLYNLIAPPSYVFLQDAQMTRLSSILLASVGSPIIAERLKKISKS